MRTGGILVVALLGVAAAPATADDDDSASGWGNSSLITVIDNSHADSILEVDRTANTQAGSGTAGSDHDGSAVDAIEALKGAPPEEEGD
ncbi:hypothetical protein AB0E77_11680 [Streptomyces sp. NPDC032940]|uniref:hypothetical protein n=1 Tax=Streptomyces sp. NPDC032940 TaxID=3155366 RepID=UPI0033EEB621